MSTHNTPSGSDMHWDTRLAQRTSGMRSSAIRELLKITQQPEVISFAGGLPAPELFPVREIEEACELALSHGAWRLKALRAMIKSSGRWEQFWIKISQHGFSKITRPVRPRRQS